MNDCRIYALFEAWAANLTLTWDENEYSETDVLNVLQRAGAQVGIGEFRPWFGRFKVEGYGINE